MGSEGARYRALQRILPDQQGNKHQEGKNKGPTDKLGRFPSRSGRHVQRPKRRCAAPNIENSFRRRWRWGRANAEFRWRKHVGGAPSSPSYEESRCEERVPVANENGLQLSYASSLSLLDMRRTHQLSAPCE
jgi:hypothetical protein